MPWGENIDESRIRSKKFIIGRAFSLQQTAISSAWCAIRAGELRRWRIRYSRWRADAGMGPLGKPGDCRPLLWPDVLVDPLGAGLGPENIARGVHRDAFGGAGGGCLFRRVRNEGGHDGIADAADPDAALPSVMVLRHRFRFGIGDIDGVVLVDEDAARPAELRPLVDEVAVLVEDLDAVVAAVAEKQPSLRIHRERMRTVHLAGACALLAPGLDEGAVFGKLHDPRVGVAAVSVGDEDIAIWCDQDRGRRVEFIGTVAGLA